MFPGNSPLGAIIAFFVGVGAALLFPLALFYLPVPSMGSNATSASRVSHVFPLSTLASLHSQALPLRYRQPVRASMSAIFTMEGLIERDASTGCNVKDTSGRTRMSD